ncbi:hypothetical protein LSAT2_028745 [Lamellibrachia satsuma]|nr:hypothetical protein LSAT2_028745 [Lamellibrachia satsuma]
MKPDVEIFFLDPIEISKKQQKQLLQVMDFQKNHRLRLTAHNRDRLAQQDSMMQKAQKAIEQCRDLEREIMILKEENSYLKKLINSKTNFWARCICRANSWQARDGA